VAAFKACPWMNPDSFRMKSGTKKKSVLAIPSSTVQDKNCFLKLPPKRLVENGGHEGVEFRGGLRLHPLYTTYFSFQVVEGSNNAILFLQKRGGKHHSLVINPAARLRVIKKRLLCIHCVSFEKRLKCMTTRR
jgi:hypothetical protein